MRKTITDHYNHIVSGCSRGCAAGGWCDHCQRVHPQWPSGWVKLTGGHCICVQLQLRMAGATAPLLSASKFLACAPSETASPPTHPLAAASSQLPPYVHLTVHQPVHRHPSFPIWSLLTLQLFHIVLVL